MVLLLDEHRTDRVSDSAETDNLDATSYAIFKPEAASDIMIWRLSCRSFARHFNDQNLTITVSFDFDAVLA